MWDVVNEAIGDGGEGLQRDSVYSRTTGIEFMVTAFEAARAKDPKVVLKDLEGERNEQVEKEIPHGEMFTIKRIDVNNVEIEMKLLPTTVDKKYNSSCAKQAEQSIGSLVLGRASLDIC